VIADALLQTGGTCVAPGAQPPTTRTVELGLFVLVGLFGTGHCLGMCGPLVSMYADRMDDGGRAGGAKEPPRGRDDDFLSLYAVRQHLLFNAGRVTIYTILGAAFGLLGSLLFASAATTVPFGDEIRAAAGVAVGLTIVAAGVGYLTGSGTAIVDHVPLLDRLFRRIHTFLSPRIDRWVGSERIFVLGFVHGFLPCPLLYPAFLYAFSQADPAFGAISLAALGLGTFPALFLYGTLFQSIGSRRRRLVHRLLGAVFLVLGAHTLLAGLRLFGVAVPHLFSLPHYQPL